MAHSDPEAFLSRFLETWRRRDPQGFLDLWHPDGFLSHPNMERPIGPKEIPAYVQGILDLVPDYSVKPGDWAASGDTLFLELEVGGTLAGRPVRWSLVDKFHLKDGRQKSMVAYFDQLSLLKQIDPELHLPSLIETAAAVKRRSEAG